jgi:hypothetical protein
LGLPLSNKALSRQYYQRLVDGIHDQFSGYYASKLSIVGRIVILNSTLSIMPVYFMTLFILPDSVIKEIDKIRINFLWHGHKIEQKRKKKLFAW